MNICDFNLPKIIDGGISSNREYLVFIPKKEDTFNQIWGRIKHDQKKGVKYELSLGAKQGVSIPYGFIYGGPDLKNINVKITDDKNISINFTPKASIKWHNRLKQKALSNELDLLIQARSLVVPKKIDFLFKCI